VTDDLPPVGRLLDLAGRVAIVTGASGGVGAGIVGLESPVRLRTLVAQGEAE
jgi:hypothetical protein